MPSKSPSGKFMAGIKYNGNWIYLGSFDEKRRQKIAEKIARHWRKLGVKIDDIPRKPELKRAA